MLWIGAWIYLIFISIFALTLLVRIRKIAQIFVAIACMAKATVQAALGPVMLKRLSPHSTDKERYYADTVMMICILSIVVTAPIGAFLISITGPRLLTKTKQAIPTEGIFWLYLVYYNLKWNIHLLYRIFSIMHLTHSWALYDVEVEAMAIVALIGFSSE